MKSNGELKFNDPEFGPTTKDPTGINSLFYGRKAN